MSCILFLSLLSLNTMLFEDPNFEPFVAILLGFLIDVFDFKLMRVLIWLLYGFLSIAYIIAWSQRLL
jgi:hypothetical protein